MGLELESDVHSNQRFVVGGKATPAPTDSSYIVQLELKKGDRCLNSPDL